MARTRILRTISEMNSKEIKNRPLKFLQAIRTTGYAWPVEDNVDYARQLEDIDKQESELIKNNPKIMSIFNEIIGGSYKVIRNQGLFFQVKGTRNKRYTMNEASSCARALLDVGFYLRCEASPGDLFIIDEPELNLHPKNQRTFARLIAQLVNSGIKVFITTHSDYIIKELNTLILLNQRTKHTKLIQDKYKYSDNELLDSNKISIYITDRNGKKGGQNILRKVEIDPKEGIEVKTFDDTINLMNEIQDSLIYGENLNDLIS